MILIVELGLSQRVYALRMLREILLGHTQIQLVRPLSGIDFVGNVKKRVSSIAWRRKLVLLTPSLAEVEG